MTHIHVTDTKALASLMGDANGRTSRRVEHELVARSAKEAEEDLRRFGVRKADWTKVTITVNARWNRQPPAKSYGYSAHATEVVLGYNSKGWYVKSAGSKRALPDTEANRRNYFVSIPTDVLNVEKLCTAIGFVRV